MRIKAQIGMVMNLDIRRILARMDTQSVAKLKRRTGDV